MATPNENEDYILISEATGFALKKLMNEESAADLIGITHRQWQRWRQLRKEGKAGIENPPYYLIDGVRRYERDLLVQWWADWNRAEILRKRGKKARNSKVVEPYFSRLEESPLIEGEQKYRKQFKPEWMIGLTDEEVVRVAHNALEEEQDGVTFRGILSDLRKSKGE